MSLFQQISDLTKAADLQQAQHVLNAYYREHGETQDYVGAQFTYHFYASEFEEALALGQYLYQKWPESIFYCYMFAEVSAHLGDDTAIRAALDPMLARYEPWTRLQVKAEIYDLLGDDAGIRALAEGHHDSLAAPQATTQVIFNIAYSHALIRTYGITAGLDTYYRSFVEPKTFAKLYHVDPDPGYWVGQYALPAVMHTQHIGGYGDAFQWQRYAAAFQGNGTVYHPLQRAPLPFNPAWLADYATPCIQNALPQTLPPAPLHEMWVTAFSLFTSYFPRLGYMPPHTPVYLVDHTARAQDIVTDMRTKAKGKRTLLVFWSANESGISFPKRSLRLADMRPLLSDESVHWVVCQRGVELGRWLNDPLSANATTLPPDLDFTELMEVIEAVDGVVGIDSSVIHLAGSLMKPCYMLTCSAYDWRWESHPTSSPWYNTLRLIRQRKAGDWAGLVADAQQVILT